MGKPYRILSLDGGGTWALLQVMALQDIYGDNVTGHKVLKDFDLVAANSGGSIVLAGLALDLPLAEIFALFGDESRRRRIFVETGGFSLPGLVGLRAKYSAAEKRKGLADLLTPFGGSATLDQLAAKLPNGPSGGPCRLLIVALDYDLERAEFFRTFATAAKTPASTVTLIDAVHASSNAPVAYFDKPATCGNNRYWDGAIAGYNNPLMAAITEAVADGVALDDIVARSIGTATVRLPLGPNASPHPEFCAGKQAPNPVGDLRKLATSITDDPPDAALYSAYVLLGGRPSGGTSDSGRLVRLSPSIQPIQPAGNWTSPVPDLTPSQFGYLTKLGMDAVDQDAVNWIVYLGRAWINGAWPNQPVRYERKTLGCQIGDATFPAGKARW